MSPRRSVRHTRTLAPRSLFQQQDESEGPLTESEARDLASKVIAFASGAETVVTVSSAQSAWTEVDHNQVSGASDTRFTSVNIVVAFGPQSASITTNHLDDDSLRAAVARAASLARQEHVGEQVDEEPLQAPGPVNEALWHPGTLQAMKPESRFDVLQQTIASIEAAGLTGAGYVGMSARSLTVLTSSGHFEYGRTSSAECSISARTPDNTGSGWAAWKGENWDLADPLALASRAADVAHHSRFPITVEPGRFTVVLSPVAVAELVGAVIRGGFDGRSAEEGRSPFSRENGTTAIGTKVFSEHITMTADPMDPDGGFLPFSPAGRNVMQYTPVTWVRDGVLVNLAYDGLYARAHGKTRLLNSGAVRMRGDDVSVDDMIASVDHGIYVTRFSSVSGVPHNNYALTGITRDGTFLIEHGKITRALRNLRFQASPFQMLRDVTVLGKTERTPVGGPPIIVPGMVVNEFLFTAITEAV